MVKHTVIKNFDKIQHFVFMSVISSLLGIVFGIFFAVVSASAISMSKELYDNKVKKEEIELGDLTADSFGIVFGALLVFFIRLFNLL